MPFKKVATLHHSQSHHNHPWTIAVKNSRTIGTAKHLGGWNLFCLLCNYLSFHQLPDHLQHKMFSNHSSDRTQIPAAWWTGPDRLPTEHLEDPPRGFEAPPAPLEPDVLLLLQLVSLNPYLLPYWLVPPSTAGFQSWGPVFPSSFFSPFNAPTSFLRSSFSSSGAPKRSQIRDLVPNGTKVPIWSQKSPDFAYKSQISVSTCRCCWKEEAHSSWSLLCPI